jgi:putative ABC transport system substrate-binding protein
MRRRDIIATLIVCLAKPRTGIAQKKVPVLGFLNGGSSGDRPNLTAAFLKGLGENGFEDGRDVAIAYRWADNDRERLTALAADLAGRQVDAIVTCGGDIALIAARKATNTIPIVGTMGNDPLEMGYVRSIAHPEANLTGIMVGPTSIYGKQLEILHELVPHASPVTVLMNQSLVPRKISGLMGAAAQQLGLTLRYEDVSSLDDLDRAIGKVAGQPDPALFVAQEAFFNTVQVRNRVIASATALRVPAIYPSTEGPESGGLISYGPNVPEIYRNLGQYAARLLKGDKPGDLPILQPAVFDLVINLKAAKELGIRVPPTLLVRADKVIE